MPCSMSIFRFFFFFFNDTATTEIYTLSLHDALPISQAHSCFSDASRRTGLVSFVGRPVRRIRPSTEQTRSEEHTSELQSHLNLVCRLLLEKKKTPTSQVPLSHLICSCRPRSRRVLQA